MSLPSDTGEQSGLRSVYGEDTKFHRHHPARPRTSSAGPHRRPPRTLESTALDTSPFVEEVLRWLPEASAENNDEFLVPDEHSPTLPHFRTKGKMKKSEPRLSWPTTTQT